MEKESIVINKKIKNRSNLTATPHNDRSELNTDIRKGYATHGMGLVHALCKDVTQNSWGAKVKKGKNFKLVFELIEKNGKTFITMTDNGRGLGGSRKNLNEVTAEDLTDINNNYLRAIFIKNPGSDNETGGLFGQGKLVVDALSEDRKELILLDSLLDDKDKTYLFNLREWDDLRAKNFPEPDIGVDAKNSIHRYTNGLLTPLTEAGTRWTIVRPQAELVKSFKNGNFEDFLAHTWWEVLLRKDIDGIYVKIKDKIVKVKCPQFYLDIENNSQKYTIHKPDLNRRVEWSGGKKGKVKKAFFGFSETPLDPRYNGIMVQRHEMPVIQKKNLAKDNFTKYALNLIPETHKNRFFAIIVPDRNNLGKEISNIENKYHYSLDRDAGIAFYDAFREWCTEEARELCKLVGLDRDSETPMSRKEKEYLDIANKVVSGAFEGNFSGGIGIGEKSKDYSINLIDYKSENSPILPGETISDIYWRITNHLPVESSNIEYEVSVVNKENEVFDKLDSGFLIVPGNKGHDCTSRSSFVLDAEKYRKYKTGDEPIYIKCAIKDGKGQEKSAQKAIYINVHPPKNEKDFNLKLDCDYPNEGSIRVNRGQSIKNISCTIVNNTPIDFKGYVKAELWNETKKDARKGKINKNMHPAGSDFIVKSNLDRLELIGDIVFSDNLMLSMQGIFELRVGVYASQDQDNGRGDIIYSGTPVATRTIRFYYNQDPEGSGPFKLSTAVELDNNKVRVESRKDSVDGCYTCRINMNHPQYKTIRKIKNKEDGPSPLTIYMTDVQVEEGLKVCIKSKQYKIFKVSDNEIEKMDPIEIAELLSTTHGKLMSLIASKGIK